MQRVNPGISNAFGPVEEDIAKAFLPALFEGAGDGAPGRDITRFPVKQAGIALTDPTQTAPENWQASCVITGHLVSALRGQVPFRTADHTACLRDGTWPLSADTRCPVMTQDACQFSGAVCVGSGRAIFLKYS